MPSPGRIAYLRAPSGPGVRDDSGVYAGYTVPTMYDPMISKLSVWAPTRAEAVARMKRALGEYVVKGITTNLRYLRAVMDQPEFAAGDYDTSFLPRNHAALTAQPNGAVAGAALLASVVYARLRDLRRQRTLAPGEPSARPTLSPWRLQGRRPRR
jgi:acetyl-CoA carboxylase biotin carboxylase subunit